VRTITYAEDTRVVGLSRNDRDATATYPELGELTELLDERSAVLDGEIVALDPAGRPSFAELQRRMHVVEPTTSLVAAVPVVYYVFDLLQLDGRPTLALPYRERRELLAGLSLHRRAVQAPSFYEGAAGSDVMAAARQRGLEGVVAKRLTSPYRPGRRSPDWIKTPINHTQEVIIIATNPAAAADPGRSARSPWPYTTPMAGCPSPAASAPASPSPC
jgi:bifunctional non-homologous end joining protein LigD